MISAMAIVPDDGTVALPDDPPTILVSAKYIDATLTENLNAQLGFQDIAFTPGQSTGQTTAETG